MKISEEIVICMPVYNEADGIKEFLIEIDRSVSGNPVVVIVDDASSDSTLSVIRSIEFDNISLLVKVNEKNLGHGPSTLRALSEAAELSPTWVVAVDGDGQIGANDILRLISIARESGADITEGVRCSRSEPWFRRIITLSTRFLCAVRSAKGVQDANTPFRVYRTPALECLLRLTPPNSPTPNLWMTVISRLLELNVMTVEIEARPRRGLVSTGTTWGRNRRILPSKRLIEFCTNAVLRWFNDWPEVRSGVNTAIAE